MGALINFVSNLKEKPFIKSLIGDLNADIYAIGGVVRDLILNKQNKDIDLVVRKVPIDTLISHLKKFGRVDAVGKSFGVLKFIDADGVDYDIALPRTDKKNDAGGYRGFDVQSDENLPIEADLTRRDAKLNAMAININTGKFIDPLGGLNDIENKQISAANPEVFSDDPLRLLRMIQFASRFGFTIEPETMQMIKDNASRVKEIAPERILTEFDKIIKKGNILTGAILLDETRLLKEIFGRGLYYDFRNTKESFDKVRTMGEFVYLLSKSLVNDPAEFYKTNLKGDIPTYKEIKALELAFDSSEATNLIEARSVAHNMYVISPQSLESQILPPIIKTAADELLQGKYPKTVNELAVKGNDLVGLGLKGKEVGDMQKSLLIKIYADKVRNNREELLSLAGQNKSVEEGVADAYAEREFGIPNDYRVSDVKASAYIQRELEKPVATATESEFHEGAKTSDIYKNPKSLQNFDENVRAIVDLDGNLYVMQRDIDVMHGGMGRAIGFKDYVYDNKNKYALLHRVGTTNSFGLGDTSLNAVREYPEAILNLLRKAKAKNRKYDFYTEYFSDIKPGMKKVGLAKEGVGDKYAERAFNIPDTNKVSDVKAASYVQREEKKPFKIIRGKDNYGKSWASPIYKNPKLLNNFGNSVRAIGDKNGDLYIALDDGWFNHGDMAHKIGLTKNDMAVYDNRNFILLHRVGIENKFGLADSSENHMKQGGVNYEEGLDILYELMDKNPQYKFYDTYFEKVDNNTPALGEDESESLNETLDSITEALESLTEALEYPEIVPNKYLVNGQMVGLNFFVKKYDEWNNQGGKPGYQDPSKESVLEFFQNNYEDFINNKKLLQDLLWALTDRELLNESNE